jgi:surface antigen
LVTALGEADALPANDALEKALDPHAAGNPVSWTSSGSGRSGNFAAVGEAYLQDDRLCRGFVASIAEDGSRNWMRGAACRSAPVPGRSRPCCRSTAKSEHRTI